MWSVQTVATDVYEVDDVHYIDWPRGEYGALADPIQAPSTYTYVS